MAGNVGLPKPRRVDQDRIGVVSELVDQHDAAIFEVTKAMVGAMAIYRERNRGR